MQSHKEAVRHRLKARRQTLSTEEVASLSRQIVRNAIGAIDWPAITSLHIYQAIRQQHEVDTTALFQMVWEHYPDIQTATWQKTADSYILSWVSPNGFRIPVLPGHQFSAIVVPLLGFNDARHRIGFGGGFYDRFLATQPGSVTIGLCYEFGYTAAFSPEAHDVPLTCIVTEKRQTGS